MDPQAQNGTPQPPPPPPPEFVPMNQDTSQAGNAPPPPPGFVPLNAGGSVAQPAETPRTETLTLQSNAMGKTPVTYTVPSDLTSNPPDPKTGQGEGTYKFWNAHGMPIMVPYSKALALLGHPEGALGSGQSEVDRFHQAYSDLKAQGFTLDDADVPRLYSDYAEDPRLKDVRAQNFYKSIPAIGYLRGAARTVAGGIHATGNQAPHGLDVLAKTPNNPDPYIGAMQTVTEAAENVNEFMAGDELLSGMTKILGPGVKLAEAGKVEQEIQKGSALGKLALTALRQGAVAGGQTYAKTGGDAGAAATAAEQTALLSGGLSTLRAGGAAIKTARAGTAEADTAAAAAREQTATESAAAANRATEEARAADSSAYSDVARGAAKPHMEAINAARGNAQPMLALGAKAVDIDHVLNTTHDFTGAADRLTEVNNEAYDALDKATDNRFRDLNKEVAKAQKAAWKGGNDEKGAYIEKLNEMEDLLNGHMGEAGMEELPAVKASWKQSYILRDIGNTLDRNLRGLPGASDVSNAQRGINGKGLHNDLLRLVKDYTRPKLEQVLGPGRLDTLEQIAEKNMTDKQRQVFNGGVRTVAQELERMEQTAPNAKPPAQGMTGLGKRAGAAAIGGLAAHAAGMTPYWGMAAGEAGYEATHAVLNAIKANPKIAQNFMFALESGATAKHFGPFIAEMIQKNQTEASRERQAEEAPKEEGGSEQ